MRQNVLKPTDQSKDANDLLGVNQKRVDKFSIYERDEDDNLDYKQQISMVRHEALLNIDWFLGAYGITFEDYYYSTVYDNTFEKTEVAETSV